jgi:hypothetical protein
VPQCQTLAGGLQEGRQYATISVSMGETRAAERESQKPLCSGNLSAREPTVRKTSSVMRDRTIGAWLAPALLLLLSAGCTTAQRYVVRPVIALTSFGISQDSVFSDLARAEGPTEPGTWNFETPHRLRPCCAFGTELGARVGYLPIAGLKLENIVDLHDLGTHQYNNGLVSLQNEPSNAFISSEKNGLIYTCRGSVHRHRARSRPRRLDGLPRRANSADGRRRWHHRAP